MGQSGPIRAYQLSEPQSFDNPELESVYFSWNHDQHENDCYSQSNYAVVSMFPTELPGRQGQASYCTVGEMVSNILETAHINQKH